MIKLSKEAFKMKGESGDDLMPEVGDMVPLDGFTAEVKSLDGDAVVVDLKEYNGMPVEYAEAAKKKEACESDEDSEKKDLLEMMSKGEEE